jgi:hypothetical protein
VRAQLEAAAVPTRVVGQVDDAQHLLRREAEDYAARYFGDNVRLAVTFNALSSGPSSLPRAPDTALAAFWAFSPIR